MLNKVLLIGRLGKDPDLKAIPDGTPVARFSLATQRSWRKLLNVAECQCQTKAFEYYSIVSVLLSNRQLRVITRREISWQRRNGVVYCQSCSKPSRKTSHHRETQ